MLELSLEVFYQHIDFRCLPWFKLMIALLRCYFTPPRGCRSNTAWRHIKSSGCRSNAASTHCLGSMSIFVLAVCLQKKRVDQVKPSCSQLSSNSVLNSVILKGKKPSFFGLGDLGISDAQFFPVLEALCALLIFLACMQ